MTITTRSERKRRRLDALAKLNTGWGVGDTISYLVKDYKITRRSANLDVTWEMASFARTLITLNMQHLSRKASQTSIDFFISNSREWSID